MKSIKSRNYKLEKIAKKLGIKMERIRQIETLIFTKLSSSNIGRKLQKSCLKRLLD